MSAPSPALETPAPAESNLVTRALIMLIGTTGFEVAGLIIWFELDARAMSAIGLIILFIGLVLERLVVSRMPKSLSEWMLVLGSSWWEYAAWGLWLNLIHNGVDPLGTLALVLFPGLHFQHAFLVSVSINKTFGELVLSPGFIVFSLIEAIGGALWLAALTASPGSIPPHFIILITITIEHALQGVVINMLNQKGALAQVAKAH